MKNKTIFYSRFMIRSQTLLRLSDIGQCHKGVSSFKLIVLVKITVKQTINILKIGH